MSSWESPHHTRTIVSACIAAVAATGVAVGLSVTSGSGSKWNPTDSLASRPQSGCYALTTNGDVRTSSSQIYDGEICWHMDKEVSP